MKLYNLYFLRKIGGYFAMTLGVLVCLIWFTKVGSFIKYITDKGIDLSQFLYLFLLVLPWLLMLIIPISLFITVLSVYNRMNASNEITIFKNSGLNKSTLAKPAIWIALACTVICYLISFYLMPMSNKKLRLLKSDFQHNYANVMISPGIFENIHNLTIYVRNRDDKNKLFGILIYDRHNSEYSLTITSESGEIIKEEESILLYMSSGTIQKFNYDTKKSEILNFDNYVVNLNENEDSEFSFRWKPQERYIHELLNPNDDSEAEDLIKYRIEFHQRIIYPLFSLILALIAVTFALEGKFSRRGNLINNIIAIVTGLIFIGSIVSLADLIESSPNLVFLLYLDIVIFILISSYLLSSIRKKI